MEGSTPYPGHENTNQERNETMLLQINDVAPDFDATDFEVVRPHLLDLVQGTTACSRMVFYGLLAWANLPTDNLSNAHADKAHRVDAMTSSALPNPVALRPTWKGNLIFLLVVAVVVLAVAS